MKLIKIYPLNFSKYIQLDNIGLFLQILLENELISKRYLLWLIIIESSYSSW